MGIVVFKIYQKKPKSKEFGMQGFPKDWPAEILQGAMTAPNSDWKVMTDEEYNDYINDLQPAYNAWKANNPNM